MNLNAIKAIYIFEMARFFRTLTQSLVSPVISGTFNSNVSHLSAIQTPAPPEAERMAILFPPGM